MVDFGPLSDLVAPFLFPTQVTEAFHFLEANSLPMLCAVVSAHGHVEGALDVARAMLEEAFSGPSSIEVSPFIQKSTRQESFQIEVAKISTSPALSKHHSSLT